VRAVMAEGEVFSVVVDEGVRDDEDHEDGDAEEDEDEEKVRLIGGELFDFHEELDARVGGSVGVAGRESDFELGGCRNLTDDGCSCIRRQG